MMGLAQDNTVRDEALIAHEIELERLFNKNQTHSRIDREFRECKQFNFAKYMDDNGIPQSFGFDLLVQMVLHKRCDLPTLVGILRKHFKGANASQQAADMLVVAAKADLVNWSPALEIFIIHDRLNITPDVQAELDRYQFALPMVVPPIPLRTNKSNAHLMGKDGSVILRNNHHDEDVCLDHLNRLNAIKFTLDNDTANMIANTWRNLDKPKNGEKKQDYDKRVRAFNKFDLTAREVMDLITKLGNEFHLTHKYDKRGRTYCQGYHVNYQGAPWNKAVIQLAEKEIVPLD